MLPNVGDKPFNITNMKSRCPCSLGERIPHVLQHGSQPQRADRLQVVAVPHSNDQEALSWLDLLSHEFRDGNLAASPQGYHVCLVVLVGALCHVSYISCGTIKIPSSLWAVGRGVYGPSPAVNTRMPKNNFSVEDPSPGHHTGWPGSTGKLMIVGCCQPIEARQWGLRAVVDNGPYPFRFVHSRGWQLKGRGPDVDWSGNGGCRGAFTFRDLWGSG